MGKPTPFEISTLIDFAGDLLDFDNSKKLIDFAELMKEQVLIILSEEDAPSLKDIKLDLFIVPKKNRLADSLKENYQVTTIGVSDREGGEGPIGGAIIATLSKGLFFNPSFYDTLFPQIVVQKQLLVKYELRYPKSSPSNIFGIKIPENQTTSRGVAAL